jgi:hypothetical protein
MGFNPLAFIANPGLAIGAATTGGLEYISQQDTNQTNRDIASQATNANMASAREQMAFQERMSNTAFQRAKDDMLKAGINPMLAYMNPSSTPSGAAGSAVSTTVQNPVSPAMASARQSMQVMNELQNSDSQRQLNNSLQQKANADKLASASSARKMQAETANMEKNRPQNEFQNKWSGKFFSALDGLLNDSTTARQKATYNMDKLPSSKPKKRTELEDKPQYIP